MLVSCVHVLPSWEQPLRTNPPLAVVFEPQILQLSQEVPRALGLKHLKKAQNTTQCSFSCCGISLPPQPSSVEAPKPRLGPHSGAARVGLMGSTPEGASSQLLPLWKAELLEAVWALPLPRHSQVWGLSLLQCSSEQEGGSDGGKRLPKHKDPKPQSGWLSCYPLTPKNLTLGQ